MNRKRKGYCPDLCCHCCVLCLTAYTANDSQHNTRMFLWRAPATSVPPAHSPSIGFLTSTLSQIVRFIELKQWYERVFFFFFLPVSSSVLLRQCCLSLFLIPTSSAELVPVRARPFPKPSCQSTEQRSKRFRDFQIKQHQWTCLKEDRGNTQG